MVRSAFIALVVALCCFHQPGFAQVEPLVMQAAEAQLPVFIARIPGGQEASYGFTSEDNMEQCTIGKPYRTLVFTSEFYTTKLEDDVNYLSIKNEWLVPVTITGQNRVLLTVAGNPGNFSVSGMKWVALAKELQQKSTGLNTSDTWYLLQVTPLSADFVVTEHDNSFVEAQFIPLASAVSAIPTLGKNKKATYTLEEVQQMIKDVVGKKTPAKDPPKKKLKKKSKN